MLDYEWSVGTFLSQLFPDNEWRIMAAHPGIWGQCYGCLIQVFLGGGKLLENKQSETIETIPISP